FEFLVLVLIGRVVAGDAGPAAAGAYALLGRIERGRALRADGRPLPQIVELRPAVRADLLVAQLNLGQEALSLRSAIERTGRAPRAGRSLATIGRCCQKLCLLPRAPTDTSSPMR